MLLNCSYLVTGVATLGLILPFGVFAGLAASSEEFLEYKVEEGEIHEYEYLTIYNAGSDNPSKAILEVSKDDGAKVNITIQKGTGFTFRITTLNDSGVFGKYSFEDHTLSETKSNMVMKTTHNKSYWKETVENPPPLMPCELSGERWLEGDIYYIKQVVLLGGLSIGFAKTGYNWKTGWLIYCRFRRTDQFGNLLNEEEFQAISLKEGNLGISGFEMLPVLAILLLGGVTWSDRRK